MHLLRLLVVAAFVFSAPAGIRADDDAKKPDAEPPKFELRDGDRVVFLGNTLIERAQRYGYWETMLTARYPDKNITFRNLGWSGDTVWAESRGMFDPPEVGYQRMIEHVARLKPTVIFLGYGNNEAFAGQDGLPAFIKQYNKLLDDLTRVSAAGVRFVIIVPHRRLQLEPPLPDSSSYNRKFAEYASAIIELAKRRSIPVIGVFMHSIPGVADNLHGILTQTKSEISTNGVHLTKHGYWVSSTHISTHMNDGRGISYSLAIDHNGKRHTTDGFTHFRFKPTQTGLWWSVARRNLVGPDLLLVIQNLPAGTYTLKIDGKPFMTQTAEKWKGGIYDDTPDAQQYEQLRQAIVEKNRLYFYRWRPQNITYLFGFRKHEQGQNAAELAEFDKLIAAKEKEIARLKKPVPHTYEIIRVEKDNDK